MKFRKNISFLLLLILTTTLSAQVRRVQPTNNSAASNSDLSVRAKSLYENSIPADANEPWSRIIYRELDLMKGANTSLYFPEEPIPDQLNLIRLIMNLLAENRVKAYEYLDGREIFTERYELGVKDMLNKFQIIFEEKAGRNTPHITIDESDVPSNEVLSYYLKERWVFEPRNSRLVCRVEAICPILHRSGNFGGETVKYPMFWLKYDDIAPYLQQQEILSDGMNNTRRYTMNDFFVLHQYEGDIYKTMNLRNQSLMQQYPDADSLSIARKRIEEELQVFEESLWVPTETPAETPIQTKSRTTVKTESSAPAVIAEPTTVKEETTKTNPRAKDSTPSAPRESKSSSTNAPVRSVRKTR